MRYYYPITRPCKKFRREVFDRWPALVDLGYYNRRKIAGSSTWSQHAWGNAQDLGGGQQLLDLVAAWIGANRQRLGVRVLLWRTFNHYDHIHVDFTPKKQGDPPWPEENEMTEVVKMIQRSLNGAGFRDPTGATLTVDGVLGPKTEFAYASMCTAAASSGIGGSLTITSGHLEVE